MRNVIKIVALLALLGSRGAIAQTVRTARSSAGSLTTATAPLSLTQDTRLTRGAPVGHRQPQARDVPSQNPAISNASLRRTQLSIASSPSAAAAELIAGAKDERLRRSQDTPRITAVANSRRFRSLGVTAIRRP